MMLIHFVVKYFINAYNKGKYKTDHLWFRNIDALDMLLF